MSSIMQTSDLKCDYHGCSNTSTNTQHKILFYKFPSNTNRREEWAKACSMINLVNEESVICSDHFEPSSFLSCQKSILYRTAKPTVPARCDNRARFPDKDTSCSVIYPMTEDWGAYLCRLCSQPVTVDILGKNADNKNSGVHIFGEEAQKLLLREKINMCLPVPVELEDSLPKFICRQCIERLIITTDALISFQAADEKLRAELRSKCSLQDLEASNLKGKFTPSCLPYKCKQCDHIFSDINTLLSHELDHAKPISSIEFYSKIQSAQHSLPYQCPNCTQSFLSRHSLQLHSSQKHGSLCNNDNLVSVLLDNVTIEEPLFKFSDPPPVSNNDLFDIGSDTEQEINNENPKFLLNIPSITKSGEIISESDVKNSEPISKKVTTKKSKYKKPCYNTRSIAKKDDNSINELIEVTNVDITYECSECSNKYKDLKLFRKHLKIHKNKKELCNHCNKMYTKSGLKSHLLRLDKSNNQEYICDLCKKSCKNRHYLVMHIRNAHNDNKLQCSKCPRVFKSKEGLQGHLMKHDGIYSFLCDICGSKFLTQSSMRIHRRRHTQQNFFTCQICGKKIQEHNRFQDHLRTHTGETPFGCGQCDRKFHSKKLLKQHMQIHTNVRPHKCPHCNLSFKRVGNLKQHLQRHQTYRPICSICRISFNTCDERNDHRRTHTLEERELAKLARLKEPKGPKRNRNQFLCKYCKIVFNSKEEKAQHLNDNPDHVNSVKCPDCDQTFRSIQSLTVHQRVHTGERPFSCSVCLKSFRTYATCRQHTLVHSTENKFKCDVCDRAFNRLYALNVHKRSHSTERPFICSTCGRGFKQSQDMKKHMKLHLVKDNNINNDNLVIHNNTSRIRDNNSSWIIEDDLTGNLNQPLQETITIPAEIHTDLNFTQTNLLSSSNIVITVPFVHASDPHAYFNM